MVRRIALLFPLLFAAPALAGDGTVVLPIPNGGFEEGVKGWKVEEPTKMSTLTSERSAKGTYSLKIVDAHAQHGSSDRSTPVKIPGAGVYELRGECFPVSGGGLGLYVRVLDRNRKLIGKGDEFHRALGGSSQKWERFRLTFRAPENAAYLELWIHSYSDAQVVAYLDELHFVSIDTDNLKPPWQGQYKIRPNEQSKLTPADVVGPDGIVYPNWTQCGVRGDIPDVKEVVKIEDFGGKADDDADDHEALDNACRAAAKKGGGTVVLGRGTYYLGRPVTVRDSNVVIRGQGYDQTKLIFRYGLPANGVAFYHPPAGSRVGKATRIILHCLPTDLMKVTLTMDGVLLREWTRSQHSGNTFAIEAGVSKVFRQLKNGPHKLVGVATYKDGTTRQGEIDIVLDSSFDDKRQIADWQAAIAFKGRGMTGPKIKLARDGKRGEMKLALETASGLAAGDRIVIEGPATERWKDLTRNACQWGTYRRCAYLIDKVDKSTVSITQPLRIEFPVIDGSYVQELGVIENCGIEDLYIEQTENLWISTVHFDHGWNCWAQGVKVHMCGRNPVYGRHAKWCTIRNCIFDDAWFKGGGGTAYSGWEYSWDCLMEDITTYKLRHAPLFQWSASGNVIRNGVFHLSDGQWHSGWTNENLFEQCVITSERGNGSYGFGLWASPPEDEAHGPNGPRNVVYNCDVRSEKAGLWMGGMNENWLILYNRFVVDRGQGVYAKTCSFDHIIKGNVFVLKDRQSPMVELATPDCVGIELAGNRLYGGNGEVWSGLSKPTVVDNNRAFLLEYAPRPTPAVPSIYEWQNRRK